MGDLSQGPCSHHSASITVDLYKEEEKKISVQWKRWPTSCKENADTSHGEVESAGRGCGPEVLDIELSANACSTGKMVCDYNPSEHWLGWGRMSEEKLSREDGRQSTEATATWIGGISCRQRLHGVIMSCGYFDMWPVIRLSSSRVHNRTY